MDKMSGCFILETQKGLRIITTYLFSPLQYAILLIFFREFWRSRKKIETSYSASTLRDQQLFYHSIIWFGLSHKFAYLISFSLYWKILHRISDQITENKSIWYTKMVKKSGLSSNLRTQHIIISLLLHKSDQLTAALSLHVWMHAGNEMWRHSILWACKHTTFLSKLLHTNISSLKAAFILSVSSSCINRHNLQ